MVRDLVNMHFICIMGIGRRKNFVAAAEFTLYLSIYLFI